VPATIDSVVKHGVGDDDRLGPLDDAGPNVPPRIAAYERLHSAILDGTLKPGLVLSENTLAG
jgi:hypothetical protein|tara:strand:+ start:129 stop:314 length:186 start_codon:yes stop_codon:yes gene_type:complete